jgi:acetate kinase
VTRRVLVLNAGSSTLKASLVGAEPEPVAAVTLPWDGDPVERAGPTVARAIAALGEPATSTLTGIGHRVVHGGPELTEPNVVDGRILDAIRAVTPLAPLHQPPAVAVLEAALAAYPAVPQVACFDTAFHATMPETARRYPVPGPWATDFGIVRYGFHGLSVAWATRRTAELLGRPASRLWIVVAHLGAGSSVTAVDQGRSVWTSMGYTPLEGLMMATRSGSIDPGIVPALIRDGRLTAASAEDALLHRSGLLAVGGSADMRTLVERSAAGDRAATLAIDMYVDRAAAAIAEAATRLPRLDALCFTGGIGEAAAGVRSAIARRLGVLLVPRIAARDIDHDAILSSPVGTPAVVRVEAREDLEIAAAVRRLVHDAR